MKTCKLLTAALALLLAPPAVALSAAPVREDISINTGWTVRPLSDPNRSVRPDSVTLPHTWNARYTDGHRHYNREAYCYQRTLTVTEAMLGKRLFLYFEGVNSVADIFIGHRSVATHKGGYTAFCVEITGKVHLGDNIIEVWASNAFRTDVLPISGDFNVYGGIHRPVRLIVTGQDCIRPDYYASSGVLVRQDAVSASEARLTIETHLSRRTLAPLTLRTEIGGQVVETAVAPGDTVVRQRLAIAKPHLWQGRRDSYLYTVSTELMAGGAVVDRIEQTTGLRSCSVDPVRGFFLNGEPYDLHGFNRHDDFYGRGSALLPADYRADMDLIDEAGATIVRLAHYPHGEEIYRLADERGLVLWTEIPLCGPGGYLFTGYLDAAADNARQTLMEMVCQKFNHPSVCFWGLFNELLAGDSGKLTQYDDARPMVEELNRICHRLDPSRLTTFANCDEQEAFIGCADLLAWNKYFSWNGSERQALTFLKASKAAAGSVPVGVSEYGRGGSTVQHADPYHPDGNRRPGTFHSEEEQAVCHEGYLRAFRQLPFLWAKIVWQLTDTQSSIKDEGDTPGRNDKGAVSYDRQTRKDVFYLYKANWTAEPMIHLCSRRFTERSQTLTDIRAYTNAGKATLTVNGRKIGTLKPDDIHCLVWRDVRLSPGANIIKVTAGKQSDSETWVVAAPGE